MINIANLIPFTLRKLLKLDRKVIISVKNLFLFFLHANIYGKRPLLLHSPTSHTTNIQTLNKYSSEASTKTFCLKIYFYEQDKLFPRLSCRIHVTRIWRTGRLLNIILGIILFLLLNSIKALKCWLFGSTFDT